jgi:prevent-host-death family protein
MNLKSNVRPISYIKTHAAKMLKQVNDTHNPIVITQNGEAKAVLVDTENYQDMINSLGLLKLFVQAERDIETGNITEHEKMLSSIRKNLGNPDD